MKLKLLQKDFDKLLIEIQYIIKECEDNINLFNEVKKHIKSGLKNGAKGIVYDYSPYMKEEDCDQLIDLNKQAIEEYKELYTKIVFLNNAKDLNDGILKIQDFCLKKGITDIINNAIYKNDLLVDKFDFFSKEFSDNTREKEIEKLMKKYNGGEK
jgi:hypothetical protein